MEHLDSLPLPTWTEGTVLSLCVCVCVCLFVTTKQATSHKLGNLRQKVVLYKTGKFL